MRLTTFNKFISLQIGFLALLSVLSGGYFVLFDGDPVLFWVSIAITSAITGTFASMSYYIERHCTENPNLLEDIFQNGGDIGETIQGYTIGIFSYFLMGMSGGIGAIFGAILKWLFL